MYVNRRNVCILCTIYWFIFPSKSCCNFKMHSGFIYSCLVSSFEFCIFIVLILNKQSTYLNTLLSFIFMENKIWTSLRSKWKIRWRTCSCKCWPEGVSVQASGLVPFSAAVGQFSVQNRGIFPKHIRWWRKNPDTVFALKMRHMTGIRERKKSTKICKKIFF